MKKITFLLFALMVFSFTNLSEAQCAVDTAEGPYTNFNTSFGGAPCDDGSGSPFNEITAFESWADEAYLMDNIISGYTYTFSLCNGPGAGSWTPSFTIVAPSGAVDAFGLNAGSTCALTWTATEDGTYTIVISEEGVACGFSTNQSTDNGFPAITGTDGENCAACEELFPPSCTTVIEPTDNAIDVVTTENVTEGVSSRQVSLEWDAVTGADAYEISFDGVVLGQTPNSAINIYGLDYDTTYTWSIAPVNCAGVTSGCATWTFTTETENLSINDFNQNSFSHNFNNTNSTLKIESRGSTFTSIEIYSITGKNVLSKQLNDSVETINVSELTDGIYLAKININGNSKTFKFLKN